MDSLPRPSRRSLLTGAAALAAFGPSIGAAQDATRPLDPASAAVHHFLDGPNDQPQHQKTLGTIPAALEQTREAMQASTLPMAEVTDTDVPFSETRLPVRLYRPETDEERPPMIVYAPGGAFVAGSIDSHDHMARYLAQACGAIVASVGYRRAPENPYPAGLDDVSDALRWIAGRGDALGGDRERIGLIGDGAGGFLAAGTAIRNRLTPYPGLKFLGLMTPYLRLDDRPDFASRRELGGGEHRPSLADLAWLREQYLNLGEDERPRGLVSPLSSSGFKGLPPTLVITAGYDPLRDEGGFFVRRLRESGVIAGERRFDTTIHDFMFYTDLIPAARLAFDVVGAQFRTAIAT